MSVLNRINLRHNWPLIVAGIVFIASLSILQDMPYRFSKTIPFDIKEIVDYPNLLFKYGGFPITRVLILVLFALLTLLGARTVAESSKVLPAIIILIASATLCVGCTMGIMSGDGSSLSHVQTLRVDNVTYQLARVRTLESGLLSDAFWVFQCAVDETRCSYIEHNGRNFNPVLGADTPEPSALLTIDPTTNALYLQIGNQKTVIAQ